MSGKISCDKKILGNGGVRTKERELFIAETDASTEKRKVSQVEGAFTRCRCWKSILRIEDTKGMTDALIDLMGA